MSTRGCGTPAGRGTPRNAHLSCARPASTPTGRSPASTAPTASSGNLRTCWCLPLTQPGRYRTRDHRVTRDPERRPGDRGAPGGDGPVLRRDRGGTTPLPGTAANWPGSRRTRSCGLGLQELFCPRRESDPKRSGRCASLWTSRSPRRRWAGHTGSHRASGSWRAGGPGPRAWFRVRGQLERRRQPATWRYSDTELFFRPGRSPRTQGATPRSRARR